MPKQAVELVRQFVLRRVAEARLYNRKLSVDQLYDELVKEFGSSMPVGRTTVWKLRKEALDAIKNESQSPLWWDSSPQEWSPEAYPFLLALNRYCVLGIDRGRNTIGGDFESSQLTFKEAKWGATLYSTLGDAPINLAYSIVALFASRETVQEMYDHPIGLDDLVGFLEYRPWESPDANETYELACQFGRIPRILGAAQVESLEARRGEIASDRIESVEITPSRSIESDAETIDGIFAVMENLVAPENRPTRQKLINIVERARILIQVADERIKEIQSIGLGDS